MRFITAYKSDVVSEGYWKELAQTDDTLVFYMSSETLSDVVDRLTANNINAEKLLAVVEQATTPCQQVHVSSLYKYHDRLSDKKFASPTLVIIGKVVALHRQFAWFHSVENGREYFKSGYEAETGAAKTFALTA